MNIIAETKLSTISNCAFIMYYSFNPDFKLAQSVKGVLIQSSLTIYYNIQLLPTSK